MQGIRSGWDSCRCWQLFGIFFVCLCLTSHGAIAQAAVSQESGGGPASKDVQIITGGDVIQADLQQDGLAETSSAGIDGEDEVSLKKAEENSPDTGINSMPPEKPAVAESLKTGPPSPPPDVYGLRIDENVLLASNTASTAKPADTDKTAPVPEPKTSKSGSVSTPLLVGAGIAIVAGAVAAAGGSGSDSDDSGLSTPAPPSGGGGNGPSANSEVINLASLVRIGDDTDYNGNHPDHFKQNRPSGTSWTDSFNISNANTVTSAKFKYTVAASKVGNPVYINGKQAGRLCNPGNTAWNVESCSMGITGLIRSGSNEIKIKCAIDKSDTDTPYDDVELYNLRIELTR